MNVGVPDPADASADVEFLDPDDPAADDPAAQDVQWLDEEGVGGGRDPAALPPRAAPRRVLASLLALGVFLAGTGSAAAAAYRRHVTDRRIANELMLHAAASPPSIPDLASLAFASGWRARVTERVLVPVVNQGPRPVELLGALLVESGLVGPAKLTPVGGGTLRPGATGELAGTVTADCADTTATDALIFSSDGPGATTMAEPFVQVRARTSGGRTATALLDPENDEAADLRARICQQEGDHLTGPQTVTTSFHKTSHLIIVRVSARSNADVQVQYEAQARYEDDPTPESGLSLSAQPVVTHASGLLDPGGGFSDRFLVEVRHCPSKPLTQSITLLTTLSYTVQGEYMGVTTRAIELDPLIAAACA